MPPGLIPLVLGIIIIVISIVFMLYPNVQVLGVWITIPEIVPGLLIGVGITLIATGLNEYSKFLSSTTKLDKPALDLEVFPNRPVATSSERYNVYRVSALIHNKGSIIVRDVKAVVKLEGVDVDTLRRMLVPKVNGHCGGSCPAPVDCAIRQVIKLVATGPIERVVFKRTYLVNVDNPRITGELLPWACPEKPIPRPGSADYVHITSISPHQTARLLFFEFIPVNNRYLIRIFSEYGAPGPNDPYPRHFRACLLIGDGDELRLKVTVAGEGLRKPLQFRLVIQKTVLDEALEHIKEGNMNKAINML